MSEGAREDAQAILRIALAAGKRGTREGCVERDQQRIKDSAAAAVTAMSDERVAQCARAHGEPPARALISHMEKVVCLHVRHLATSKPHARRRRAA